MFEDDDDVLICNKDTFMDLDDSETINTPIPYKYTSIQNWIALLPRYTENLEELPSLSIWRGFSPRLRCITSLKEANMDSHFEQVFVHLQPEWNYMVRLVCHFRFINMFSDRGLFFIYSSWL